MIIESIFNLLFAPIMWLIDLIPSLETIQIPDGAFGTIKTLLTMCSAVLPLDTVLTILKIKITFLGINIAWALILRAKSFIPTMGD